MLSVNEHAEFGNVGKLLEISRMKDLQCKIKIIYNLERFSFKMSFIKPKFVSDRTNNQFEKNLDLFTRF